MTMPTAEEAICLYLYGQRTPPENLMTDQLIRASGEGANLSVDMNEYMTIGGGRFIKVENFNYVRNFLAASDYVGILQPGTYTRDELLEAYGIDSGRLDAAHSASSACGATATRTARPMPVSC